jgi:hypothetical protein
MPLFHKSFGLGADSISRILGILSCGANIPEDEVDAVVSN